MYRLSGFALLFARTPAGCASKPRTARPPTAPAPTAQAAAPIAHTEESGAPATAAFAQKRMRTISYGKERPLDPGSDEQAWARNRNAHTMLGS